MTEKPLGYQPRGDHDDQRDRDNNCNIRSQGSAQFVPGIDQSYRGRYKQQWHNEDQKIRYFFHIIHLQDLLFQIVNCLNSFKVNSSYYTFQVVPFYHNIGKISMFVSICLADFADKTRLVVKTTNLEVQTRMVTGILPRYFLIL